MPNRNFCRKNNILLSFSDGVVVARSMAGAKGARYRTIFGQKCNCFDNFCIFVSCIAPITTWRDEFTIENPPQKEAKDAICTNELKTKRKLTTILLLTTYERKN